MQVDPDGFAWDIFVMQGFRSNQSLCLVACLVMIGCGTETPENAAESDGGPIDMAPPETDRDTRPEDLGVMADAGEVPCGEREPVPDCRDVDFTECEARPGSNGAVLMRGTVITPDRVICNGEVLFSRIDGHIECVGENCVEHPASVDASVICADLVLPGMIDPHNHMSFNTLPPWQHGQRQYTNRGQWRGEIGGDLYDARPPRSDPVAARYNELRLLMAGTTSVHKAEDTRSSHSHVRNLDRGADAHGLGYGDPDFTECVFPLTNGCSYAPDYDEGSNIPRQRYVAHLSEGIDTTSRNEFDRFVEAGQLGNRTTLIHCVACAGRELSAVRAAGAHLVWSPQSNIDLYGQTTNVSIAMNMGISVALGPDWSASGTMNLLSELKCAQRVSRRYLNQRITTQDLVRMVTDQSARAMGVDDRIGRLEVGFKADILALNGDRQTPYDSVVSATATDVRAVFIEGALFYGDEEVFDDAIQRNEHCETIGLCGIEKRVCIRDEAGPADVNDRDQWPAFGYDDINTYLSRVIGSKRPDELPPWLNYVYEVNPLFECEPSFHCDLGNASVSGLPGSTDQDGDDAEDDVDNCPQVFNPEQGDLDFDGQGDACDVCPWAVDECPCIPPTGFDLDVDGFQDQEDNCPQVHNPEQTDTDEDGRGDLCDICPTEYDDARTGCPAIIQQLKARELNTEQLFSVPGLVTAVLPENAPPTQADSFFMQVVTDGEMETDFTGTFVYMGNRLPGVPVPVPGQSVVVSGRYADYFGQAQLTRIRDITIADTETVVEPHPTTILDLTRDPEPMEGTVVCVEDLIVVDITPEPGIADGQDDQPTYEFLIAHEGTPETLRINDLFFRADPFPAVDDPFAQICGVFRYANGHYKLEPRFVSDLDRGPPRVIAIGPSDAYLRVGQTGPPLNGEGAALQVFLSSPAPEEGLEVIVTVDDENAAVPQRVDVRPMEAHGGIVLEALTPMPSLGITARTATQAVGVRGQVELVARDAQPGMLTFRPARVRIGPNARVQLALEFDLPSRDAGYVSLLSRPSDGLIYPLITHFQADTRLVWLAVTSTDALGSYVLKASVGQLLTALNVEVTDGPLHPIINEVNADMSDVEASEFVEVYNPQPVPVPTEGWVLELVNGNNGEPYRSFDLSRGGPFIPANGYLVVGDGAMAADVAADAIFIDLESRGSEHDIQNGDPDGVQLRRNGLLMDSMSYGGELEGLTEGVEAAPDDPNSAEGESISRCPDGQDTNENGADFALAPMTPGAPNSTCP